MADGLKTAAYEYWSQGCNIVPLKGKQPLVSWSQWQTQRQSREEFESLPWSQADGFAAVCGTQLFNGLYFGALDYDVKNVREEAKDKGKQVLRSMLCTQIEQTPSGGQHWVYFCNNKPRTVSVFHDDCALEVLGEGKLCIMAPSEGYKKLTDNTPTVIADLEQALNEAMFKAGVKPKELKKQVWFDREDLSKKSFKGRTPPCINTLAKGASEGQRNEFGIRLASYYLNFRRCQPETVFKILRQWNKLNEPSLTEQELSVIVKSAAQGGYTYGCNDPFLHGFCIRAECPLAKKTVELTEEELKKAEKLLEQPRLLDYVLLHGRKRLIGEDAALQINFIEICSGQTLYPISGIICGFSGSGKNESLRAIKPLVPEEWLFEFTTSTPEAVKYIPEEFSGTLIIYEASGMRSESGQLGLRAVGEGESIETIYPMRDETTGRMSLGRAKTNAKNFITTDTGIDIQADLYRRVLKQSMNSSYVLTKRVLAKEVRESWFPESLRKTLGMEKEPPFAVKDFQNALRVQDWKAEVVVFTPKDLILLLDFAATREQQVALRTQFNKILSFVKILALLNQKNRVRVKIEDKKYVIANTEDYITAMRILEPTIMETISRIEKRQQEILDLFENLDVLDKNKVAEKLEVSVRTAARALKTLAATGYLRENMTCKPYSYELLREKPNSLDIKQNASEYELFYQKELKTFLNSIVTPCQNVTSTLQRKVKIEGLEKKLGATVWQVVQMPSEPVLSLSSGKGKEPLALGELSSETGLEPQEGLGPKFQCEYCKAQKRQMFFYHESDLKRHITAFHGGYPDYVR